MGNWYRVTKRINGRLYDYWQRTYRVGKAVKTENQYIGPARCMTLSVGSIKMATQLKKGAQFPPIVISDTGELIDDYHRLEAYRLAGFPNIPAIVRSALANPTTANSTKTENEHNGPLQDSVMSIVSTPVYHGTLENFEAFDTAKAGSNSGWANARFGTFFLDDPKMASEFPELTRKPGDNRPVNLKTATIDLKNPLDLTLEGIFTKAEQAPLIVEILGGEKGMSPEAALESLNETIGLGEIGDLYEALYSDIANKQLIEDAGYDGIISQYGKDDTGCPIKEYVVFDPKNISSVS